jgi:outer membrane protein OmpA-like peptidoglycan-associated protein
MKKILKSSIILVFTVLILSNHANGQINLKDRLKKTVNNAAQSVDKAIKNKDNAPKEQPAQQASVKDQQPVQQNQADTKDAAGTETQPAAQPEQTKLQSFSKYDFVPGEKVIFYEDFSQDAIGDFPALWNTNGSAEIVTTNLFPGNWMKFSTRESIWTDKLIDLPDNYTIEFDIVPLPGEDNLMKGYSFMLLQSINAKAFDSGSVPGKAGFYFNMAYYGRPSYSSYINGNEGNGLGLSGSKEEDAYKQKANQKYHIAIWMQKARIRLYQDQNKLFDLPKAFNAPGVKMDRIRFEDGTAMVTNVRIAVGAPDTRNKLITEGRLVTYGIYFDVNKDVVKPESYATLKEIAAALTDNPGVRVKIIGHTDSDGADAANLDLSKRRADSVKNELAKTFSIDASRIDTEGMGESKPIAPNDNPVNKALNRRVELVKL